MRRHQIGDASPAWNHALEGIADAQPLALLAVPRVQGDAARGEALLTLVGCIGCQTAKGL